VSLQAVSERNLIYIVGMACIHNHSLFRRASLPMR
jgi:hypothetical protein